MGDYLPDITAGILCGVEIWMQVYGFESFSCILDPIPVSHPIYFKVGFKRYKLSYLTSWCWYPWPSTCGCGFLWYLELDVVIWPSLGNVGTELLLPIPLNTVDDQLRRTKAADNSAKFHDTVLRRFLLCSALGKTISSSKWLINIRYENRHISEK